MTRKLFEQQQLLKQLGYSFIDDLPLTSLPIIADR